PFAVTLQVRPLCPSQHIRFHWQSPRATGRASPSRALLQPGLQGGQTLVEGTVGRIAEVLACGRDVEPVGRAQLADDPAAEARLTGACGEPVDVLEHPSRSE